MTEMTNQLHFKQTCHHYSYAQTIRHVFTYFVMNRSVHIQSIQLIIINTIILSPQMDKPSYVPTQKIQVQPEGISNKNESISPPSQSAVVISHFQTRIQEAISIKNEGNQLFKAQSYEQARNIYQKALAMLEPNTFYGASESECIKMAELSANLLFNIGSCFFNQHRWREAELIYNEAIIVNPFYTKALYKRALAKYELEEYEGAMQDIKKAFSFDKSNKEIYDSYEKIIVKYNQNLKKEREKTKQLSEKIFSSMKAKPKEAEVIKEEKKEAEKDNKWWLLALGSLAALGIYQGVKLLRK